MVKRQGRRGIVQVKLRVAMALRKPGGRGGGGGGVHAVIAQDSDSSKGIEIAIPYDATWKLKGVQREVGQRGYVDFRGGLTPGELCQANGS